MEMFCYQCEQAAKGSGCSSVGVCGKQPESSALQDLIVYQLKGIGFWAHEARMKGKTDAVVDRFIMEALFTTVTNVNFDDDRLVQVVQQGEKIRQKAQALAGGDSSVRPPEAATKALSGSKADLIAQGALVSILKDEENADLRSLKHLLVYGLKGMAAYADHAYILGKSDDAIFAYLAEALWSLTQPLDMNALVALNMKCGEVNIRTMEILDEAHTSRFGHPEPTVVSTGTRKGPAVVISGHDLLDLEALLIQTEGTGVNVYTHGEMLPAHGYPGLKKYPHLAGHFGTAWQNQAKEFDGAPAAFLFTTNCIQKPRDSYFSQVFTTGLVGWPGVAHVPERNFKAVIDKAIQLGGFEEKAGGTMMTGFGHNAVLSVADKVIEGVKAGAIRHFFLVGGCDGAKPGRNYYTEFVEKTPKDTVVLTLACGKFRFNHLDLGNIGGIPRLLDIGQCNDAYSAVKIAMALADAFKVGVNDLPLSLVLSWYEQKAVVILLSLLHLGIKDIRLGPTLPAFVTPAVLNFLVENFNIQPIGNVDSDLEAMLAGK